MGTTETFRFNRFTNNVPQCACISILQDSVVEGREFFEVSLRTFDSRVQLAQNSSLATVIIADDDGTYYASVLDTDVVKLMADAKWMERTLHNSSVIVAWILLVLRSIVLESLHEFQFTVECYSINFVVHAIMHE